MEKIIIEKKKRFGHKFNNFLVRYFKGLVIILAFIILVLGYFFLIGPKYKQLAEEIRAASEEKKAEYAERKIYLSKILELKNIYKQIRPDDKEKLESILPPEGGEEKLISELESIILKNGLLLASLKVEKKKQEKGTRETFAVGETKASESALPKEIGAIMINMEIIGTDYIGLKNILAAMENNLRLIDVTKLSFSPDENKTSLEALTYYRKK